MKIATLNRKYKNKWVLAEVLKFSARQEPVEVKPLLVSNDRNKIYDRMATVPDGKTVATLYTGKITGTFMFFVHVDSKI